MVRDYINLVADNLEGNYEKEKNPFPLLKCLSASQQSGKLCPALYGSNLAQAVETKKKSSLKGWQGSMCHQPALSAQHLVHIIKMSLYLALSDVALEYKQIIYGLLCQEGYASHSQLEMVSLHFFKDFYSVKWEK